jgi:hypothetical protein
MFLAGLAGGMAPNPYMTQMAMQAAIPGLLTPQVAAMQQLQALTAMQQAFVNSQQPPQGGSASTEPQPQLTAPLSAIAGTPASANTGSPWLNSFASEAGSPAGREMHDDLEFNAADLDTHMDFGDDVDYHGSQHVSYTPAPTSSSAFGPNMPTVFRFG